MTYEPPACSPDGKTLAAIIFKPVPKASTSNNLDGTGTPKLLLEGGRMPAWSADGRTLLAVKTEAGGLAAVAHRRGARGG